MYFNWIGYGKQVGVKYLVYNSKGRLLGGFVKLEDAERERKAWAKRYKRDPRNSTMTAYIKKA